MYNVILFIIYVCILLVYFVFYLSISGKYLHLYFAMKITVSVLNH